MSIVTSSFNPLTSVLREVKDLGIIAIQQPFSKVLSDIDIPNKLINEYNDESLRDVAFRDAAKLIASISTTKPDVTSLTPGVKEWMDDSFPSYVFQRAGEMSMLVHALDRARPNLVVVHNDIEPLLRLLALWAKSRGVPCLHIPHAVYIDNDGRGPAMTDVHDIITASDMCVAGVYQGQWYHQRGMDLSHIYATGLPQHDKFSNIDLSAEVAAKLFHYAPIRPVVTYFSSWRQDTSILGCHDGVEESYTAFLDAASTMPELQYIIMCHRSGNNVQYHADLAKAKGVKCIVTQDHLEVALTASDMIISYGPSNVLLEASSMKPARPLVMIGDKTAFRDNKEIIKCDANVASISAAIKSGLSSPSPDYKNFTRFYLGDIDGKSYERVASVIRKLHGTG